MGEVHVQFGDSKRDTATLLLAAAEESEDFDSGAVRISSRTGTFVVPEEIAKSAGLDTYDPGAKLQAEVDAVERGSRLPLSSVTNEQVEVEHQAALAQKGTKPAVPNAEAEPKKAPAKKAPAKKSATKKSTAKKSASKKAAPKKEN